MRLTIRVKPGAARTSVGGRHALTGGQPGTGGQRGTGSLPGDALVVAVSARAVDGKATEAALRAVADAFDVKRREVTLVTGATSRDKVIDIDGPAAVLSARRDALLGPVP